MVEVAPTQPSVPMCVSSLSGTTDISFIDPVVIGRNAFSVTNDFVSGVAAYIQDVFCAILDVTLDSLQGKVPSSHTVNCTVYSFNCGENIVD